MLAQFILDFVLVGLF